MCLAQGPQRSDAGEARTRGPSVSSQALYHWATALPLRCCVLICALCLSLVVLYVDLCSVSLPCGDVGWSVFCVSSLWCCVLICVLCLFLAVLCVDLCSVSLPCGTVCWYVLCVPFLAVLWVDLCSVSLPCGAVCWYVFCVSSLRWCGLICVLCLFLAVLCVDMCSVFLSLRFCGSISVLCLFLAVLSYLCSVYSLWCCGFICVLCLSLAVMCVDMCSVSLPCGAVGWFVFCVSSLWWCGLICVLCLLLAVMWVDMCSVSLPCGAVGWSVFCFSSLRCCGLICVLCLFLAVMWVDLCSVSLPCGDVGWSVFCVSSLRCCVLICVLCQPTSPQGRDTEHISTSLAVQGGLTQNTYQLPSPQGRDTVHRSTSLWCKEVDTVLYQLHLWCKEVDTEHISTFHLWCKEVDTEHISTSLHHKEVDTVHRSTSLWCKEVDTVHISTSLRCKEVDMWTQINFTCGASGLTQFCINFTCGARKLTQNTDQPTSPQGRDTEHISVSLHRKEETQICVLFLFLAVCVHRSTHITQGSGDTGLICVHITQGRDTDMYQPTSLARKRHRTLINFTCGARKRHSSQINFLVVQGRDHSSQINFLVVQGSWHRTVSTSLVVQGSWSQNTDQLPCGARKLIQNTYQPFTCGARKRSQNTDQLHLWCKVLIQCTVSTFTCGARKRHWTQINFTCGARKRYRTLINPLAVQGRDTEHKSTHLWQGRDMCSVSTSLWCKEETQNTVINFHLWCKGTQCSDQPTCGARKLIQCTYQLSLAPQGVDRTLYQLHLHRKEEFLSLAEHLCSVSLHLQGRDIEHRSTSLRCKGRHRTHINFTCTARKRHRTQINFLAPQGDTEHCINFTCGARKRHRTLINPQLWQGRTEHKSTHSPKEELTCVLYQLHLRCKGLTQNTNQLFTCTTRKRHSVQINPLTLQGCDTELWSTLHLHGARGWQNTVSTSLAVQGVDLCSVSLPAPHVGWHRTLINFTCGARGWHSVLINFHGTARLIWHRTHINPLTQGRVGWTHINSSLAVQGRDTEHWSTSLWWCGRHSVQMSLHRKEETQNTDQPTHLAVKRHCFSDQLAVLWVDLCSVSLHLQGSCGLICVLCHFLAVHVGWHSVLCLFLVVMWVDHSSDQPTLPCVMWSWHCELFLNPRCHKGDTDHICSVSPQGDVRHRTQMCPSLWCCGLTCVLCLFTWTVLWVDLCSVSLPCGAPQGFETQNTDQPTAPQGRDTEHKSVSLHHKEGTQNTVNLHLRCKGLTQNTVNLHLRCKGLTQFCINFLVASEVDTEHWSTSLHHKWSWHRTLINFLAVQGSWHRTLINFLVVQGRDTELWSTSQHRKEELIWTQINLHLWCKWSWHRTQINFLAPHVGWYVICVNFLVVQGRDTELYQLPCGARKLTQNTNQPSLAVQGMWVDMWSQISSTAPQGRVFRTQINPHHCKECVHSHRSTAPQGSWHRTLSTFHLRCKEETQNTDQLPCTTRKVDRTQINFHSTARGWHRTLSSLRCKGLIQFCINFTAPQGRDTEHRSTHITASWMWTVSLPCGDVCSSVFCFTTRKRHRTVSVSQHRKEETQVHHKEVTWTHMCSVSLPCGADTDMWSVFLPCGDVTQICICVSSLVVMWDTEHCINFLVAPQVDMWHSFTCGLINCVSSLGAVGWYVICVSSLWWCGLTCALYLFLAVLWVDMWSQIFLVVMWVDLCSDLFLAVLWVDMWSVFLHLWWCGLTVFCVSSLHCGDMWSVSLPYGDVGWYLWSTRFFLVVMWVDLCSVSLHLRCCGLNVICVSSLWWCDTDLCSVSLPCGDVGWYVFCVSSLWWCGLICSCVILLPILSRLFNILSV